MIIYIKYFYFILFLSDVFFDKNTDSIWIKKTYQDSTTLENETPLREGRNMKSQKFLIDKERDL